MKQRSFSDVFVHSLEGMSVRKSSSSVVLSTLNK